MRLTLHTENIAQTEDGAWVGKNPDTGAWEPIDKPAGIVVQLEQKRRERAIAPARPMTDPHKRDASEIQMVKVRRITEKLVPDYEAEVLTRNGWEIVNEGGNNDNA